MKLNVPVVLVAVLIGVSSAAEYSRTVSYEGELVIRCRLQNERIRALLNHDLVDVWKVAPDHADIRLHNDLYEEIRDKFPECTVLHSSVESLVREFELLMEKQQLNATKDDWFDSYHTYDEIVKWYEELAQGNSDLVTFIKSIGKSVEGRDQPAVHITSSADSTETPKIYFQCQIHAREWISGATCSYIADQLVNSGDDRVKNLLEKVEFIFIPFVNPDGYEYSRTNDRLWRKNRRLNSGSCDGVDLNRNYDDHWGEGGSSSNPCSETYMGPSAASEPETKNTQNYFKNNFPIIGAIDWHSYSQLILRPYGWTTTDCPDEGQLNNLGGAMREVILQVHGKSYTSQKAIGLYPATGSALDWFYSEDTNKNNKYRAAGLVIELRDTGQYGFLLPPSEILPTGEENLQAALLFAEELYEKPLEK